MSYNFTKLSDVDLMEEANESTNILVEQDGVINKIPAETFKGSSSSSGSVFSPNIVNSIYACDGFKVIKLNPTVEELSSYGTMQTMVQDALRYGTLPTKREFQVDFYSKPVILMDDYYRIKQVVSFDSTYGHIYVLDQVASDTPITAYTNMEWREAE